MLPNLVQRPLKRKLRVLTWNGYLKLYDTSWCVFGEPANQTMYITAVHIFTRKIILLFFKDALKVAIDNHHNEQTIWTVAKRVLEPSGIWYYLQFIKQ